jgi:hypothetical protein
MKHLTAKPIVCFEHIYNCVYVIYDDILEDEDPFTNRINIKKRKTMKKSWVQLNDSKEIIG